MSALELSSDARAGVDLLYRRYRQDVYKSLLRDLGSPADADDCTQTVFLSAMRALERGCRPRAARAWLLAIAKNVARKRWRERAQRSVEVDTELISSTDVAEESRRELFAVLETIPESQRTALVLHELVGLEYAEISALTDQSVAGVETAVFRARSAVRTAMRDGGALDHAHASKLLTRLVAGKLTRNEREAVAAHVRSCADCASVEAELRSGKGRRRFVLWVLSVPSAVQRLVGLLQASPARGLGAAGACALGLAAMSGDRPAGEAPQPAGPAIVVAERESSPGTAARPRPPDAVPVRPATPRRPVTSTRTRVVPSPSPAASVRRRSPVDAAPVVHPSPGTAAPAPGSARASTRPGTRHASPSSQVPVDVVPSIDVEGTVGDVVGIVGEAASGDLTGTGAAVDATVGGVLEQAGLPAPPPVAKPLTGTVEGLTATVEATAHDLLQPLAPAPAKP